MAANRVRAGVGVGCENELNSFTTGRTMKEEHYEKYCTAVKCYLNFNEMLFADRFSVLMLTSVLVEEMACTQNI
jgi:hypothetical protein